MIINMVVCNMLQYGIPIELYCDIPPPPVSAPRLPDIQNCTRKTPDCIKYK
tara:strand:- start:157 stop:309 length:153 start_codon:yes stop_codon:yes gene_type:complete